MQSLNHTPGYIPDFKRITCIGSALLVLGFSGCSTVAPSAPAKGASTGLGVGALTGAAVGSNSSMGTSTGILAGGLAGAAIGGLIGLAQQASENREQEKQQIERGYAQEISKKRQQEAKDRLAAEEELTIAQGFKISEIEIASAQKEADDAAAKLKALQEERTAAIARKKKLDDLKAKTMSDIAAAVQLTEELGRLKGDMPNFADQSTSGTANANTSPPAAPTRSPGL